MTKERFTEILKEYGYSEHQIELIWEERPADDLDEAKLHRTAKYMKPIKDHLAQR